MPCDIVYAWRDGQVVVLGLWDAEFGGVLRETRRPDLVSLVSELGRFQTLNNTLPPWNSRTLRRSSLLQHGPRRNICLLLKSQACLGSRGLALFLPPTLPDHILGSALRSPARLLKVRPLTWLVGFRAPKTVRDQNVVPRLEVRMDGLVEPPLSLGPYRPLPGGSWVSLMLLLGLRTDRSSGIDNRLPEETWIIALGCGALRA